MLRAHVGRGGLWGQICIQNLHCLLVGHPITHEVTEAGPAERIFVKENEKFNPNVSLKKTGNLHKRVLQPEK